MLNNIIRVRTARRAATLRVVPSTEAVRKRNCSERNKPLHTSICMCVGGMPVDSEEAAGQLKAFFPEPLFFRSIKIPHPYARVQKRRHQSIYLSIYLSGLLAGYPSMRPSIRPSVQGTSIRAIIIIILVRCPSVRRLITAEGTITTNGPAGLLAGLPAAIHRVFLPARLPACLPARFAPTRMTCPSEAL